MTFRKALGRAARKAAPVLALLFALACGCQAAGRPEEEGPAAVPASVSPFDALAVPSDALTRFAGLNAREANGEAVPASDSNLFDRSVFPGAERLAVRPVIPTENKAVAVIAQALERNACFDLAGAGSRIEGDVVKLRIPLKPGPEDCSKTPAVREVRFNLGRLDPGPKLLALFLGDRFHIGRRIVVLAADAVKTENQYEPLRDRYLNGNPQDRAEAAVALFDLKTKRAYTFLFKQLDSAPATALVAFNRRFKEVMTPKPDPQALNIMLGLLEYPALRTVVSRNLKKAGQLDRAAPELVKWLEREKNPARREELVQLLENLTGERLGGDVEKWKAWLNEKGGETKK